MRVTAAKQAVSQDVEGASIDISGPSEVMVMADKTADPSSLRQIYYHRRTWPCAQAILVTDSTELAEQVNQAIEQLPGYHAENYQTKLAAQPSDCGRQYG